MTVALQGEDSGSEVVQVFDELDRATLNILLPVTTLAIWVWASATVLMAEQNTLHAYLALALTLVTVGAAYELRERHLHLVVALYLVGLTAVVTVAADAYPTPLAFYLYAQVVLIAAILVRLRGTLFVTAVAALLITTLGGYVHRLPLSELAGPLLFTILTALVARLSSQRLMTTLTWTIRMTQEAQSNAEDAQTHRAELWRALKSLDEAQVRL